MSGRSVVVSVLAILMIATIPVGSAGAQVAPLIPGVRTKVTAPGIVSGRLTGTVITRTQDSLTIATETGEMRALAISAITSADVSRGRTRTHGAKKGAIWGSGILLVGSLLAAASTSDEACTSNCITRGQLVASSALGGGLYGALIGAFVKAEKWDRLEVPVRTSMTQTSGGPTLAVSLRF